MGTMTYGNVGECNKDVKERNRVCDSFYIM